MKRLLPWLLLLLLTVPALAESHYDDIVVIEEYFFGRTGDSWQLYDASGKLFVDYTWKDSEFLGGFSHPFNGFNGASCAAIRFGPEQSDTYGVIDLKGNIVVGPEFEFVYSFSCGRACVRKNGLYGFIDEGGAYIVEPIYTNAAPFSENRAAVCLNGKYGFIDTDGSMVVEPVFQDVESFHNGSSRVWLSNKVGLIDADGRYLLPPEYDMLGSFEDGLAIFRKNDQYGLIDDQGSIFIQPMYESIRHADDGVYIKQFNGEVSGFTIEGGEILPLEIVSTTFNMAPFMPNEGAAVPQLDGESSLTLTDSLPRLDGAQALLPLYAGVVEAVYPEGTLCDEPRQTESPTVACSDTARAFQRLIDGEADLVFMTPPSDSQMERAAKAGAELLLTPLGQDALLFFVHEANPLTSLTTDQLQSVYSGQITSWEALGAPSLGEIIAYQRPKDSGSQRLMEGLTLQDAPEDFVGSWDEDSTSEYRNYPNALGYVLRFFLKHPEDEGVKVLTVNNVLPTDETIADGSYPASIQLCAVSRKDNANPNIGALLEWLQGAQGQELVAKAGYVPICE